MSLLLIWTILTHLISVTSGRFGVWMTPELESDETIKEEDKETLGKRVGF